MTWSQRPSWELIGRPDTRSGSTFGSVKCQQGVRCLSIILQGFMQDAAARTNLAPVNGCF